jgi:hypothetical protein
MACLYLLRCGAGGRLFRCSVSCFGYGILYFCDLVVLFFLVWVVFLVVKFFPLVVASFCVVMADDLFWIAFCRG